MLYEVITASSVRAGDQIRAQAGEKYARHVLEITDELSAHGRGLAGFIAESLPSSYHFV